MTNTSPISGLLELLQAQQKALIEIKNIIGLELDAVKNRKGDDLTRLAQEKEKLLVSIATNDQHISAHPNSDKVESEEPLRLLKNEITELLEECQTLNEVVYLAAKQNEVAVEQVKQLLVGGSRNTTYDAYGQKKSGPSLTKGIKA